MSGSNSSVPADKAVDPAQPVSFTVHSMPPPALDSQRRTGSGRLKMLLVLLVCAAPVIASYFTYFVIRPEGRTNYSSLIQPARELPAGLLLHDLNGKAVDPASLKGQWLLVAVGGGACDAECETRLYLQRQLRETLGREKERLDKVWLVDDDAPVRQAVRDAVEPLGAMHVLRVSREALAGWLNAEEGHAVSDHFYIVDPMGNWMMRAPVNPEPARLKRDLEKLLRASSSWDQPGR